MRPEDLRGCRGVLRAERVARARGACCCSPPALAGCGAGPATRRASRRSTVYVSMPLRGPTAPTAATSPTAPGWRSPTRGGEAGGVDGRGELPRRHRGRGARARWTPAQAAANARDGDRGLDRDRLPRRLRLRRDPGLAADHQRGRGCSRSRRRAAPSTWSQPFLGAEDSSPRRPAERRAHLRPGDPERRGAGRGGRRVGEAARCPAGRDAVRRLAASATRWSPAFAGRALGAATGRASRRAARSTTAASRRASRADAGPGGARR